MQYSRSQLARPLVKSTSELVFTFIHVSPDVAEIGTELVEEQCLPNMYMHRKTWLWLISGIKRKKKCYNMIYYRS